MDQREVRNEFGLDENNESDVRKELSLIHISEPTRLGMISYAVFCLHLGFGAFLTFFLRRPVSTSRHREALFYKITH